MKKLAKVFLLVFTALLSANTFATTTPNDKGPVKPINRIIAVVNQDIITETQLDNAVQIARKQFEQQGIKLPSAEKFRAKILDGLILQKLQLQIAKQNNITASEDAINQAIAQIAKQNNTDVNGLKQKLQADDISFADFRQQISDQLIIRTLQQQAIVNSLKISRAEVSAYQSKLEDENEINDYHIVDYLIPLPADPTTAQKHAAKMRAELIIKELQQNKSITDSSVKINDMGYKSLNDLPDLFSVPIAKMGKGNVSAPILAGNGYHVLKLVNIKKEKKEISTQQAQQMLFQDKFRKALKKWLDNLRKHAYVKIYLND